MEGGREQNYWPGFVDALSNVVLTLVFVLVVFVFALLLASNKVEKKMQEVATAQQAQQKDQAELEKALGEIDKLRQQEAQQSPGAPGTNPTDQACVKFNKSDASQKADINSTNDEILITFSTNAISVTDDTNKVIQSFIQAKAGAGKYILESSDDPTSTSPLLARETQLGRILNIRNSLLNNKIDPHSISVRSTTALQVNGTYNWVRIHVEK